jgi:nitrite reductase/ring-hydroxylating ferredoxin subunit
MKADDSGSRRRVGRRDLLRAAVSTGFVLALPMLGEARQAVAGTWVPVGTAEQFKPGAPKRVVLRGGRVAFITRVDATRLSALSARCTHQGCEVGWDSGQKQFLCPCHGATFTAAGRNIRGPARSPLASMPVTQKGKQVLVNVASLPVSGRGNGRGHEAEEHERDERSDRGEHGANDDD